MFDMREEISIKNLKKAVVLKALYDGSHVQGLGFLQAVENFSIDDAKKWMDENPNLYADYVHGRVIKVNLSRDTFDPSLYDRDCGQGAARRQIDKILKGEYGKDVFINL